MAADATRCPSCGLFVATDADRNPFLERTLWATVGGLALVYLLTLLVVFFAR